MMLDGEIRGGWDEAAEAVFEEVVALRRAIHAEPEIGLQCPLTSAKIKAALAGLPLELREGTSTTGFVAILRGGAAAAGAGSNARTVLLRGDMDALPMTEETGLPFASTIDGRMHACGHDTHTAMLVGAAKALSARRDELAGTVVFMFQPGEEGYHGARFMIEDGLLADPAPDAAFALHISPNAPSGLVVGRPGTIMASADTLHARIIGRGGHAAMPHEGLDPIPVACEIVTALQVYIARQVAVTDPAVLSITKIQAGTAHNVVPGEATLLGTLRTLSEATRMQCQAAFKRIVENIAAAHGCTAEAWIDAGYPVTANDPRGSTLQQAVATELFGEGGWQTMPKPMMGAEDFSYVLRAVPGAFAFIGAAPEGSDPATNPPLHNTRMTLDERVMARGVAMHCATATRFLERGFD
ncbi:amidohydrolase [Sphingomonas sp. SORGH_AS802]|uniref:M20 metallopeptidase family protein n=1 Tax=unclassified Sphingomonas TaxID=196159 RepID=UPI00285B0EE0|nr:MULTISPECIES: M20 family metallopeptidase [unclassified Sphingomonas]MDR6127237.1 amidohydrolase [Sphingomonas sp. SORGH_AS_0438]MDR6133845.1 amidohydrolase [Sphingomonas sp. SORGH_AS_0802]